MILVTQDMFRRTKMAEKTKTELENDLGKLSFKLSLQAEVCQAENKKFQQLQQEGNELVTELKKLNG